MNSTNYYSLYSTAHQTAGLHEYNESIQCVTVYDMSYVRLSQQSVETPNELTD